MSKRGNFKLITHYRGWVIHEWLNGPVTGKFVANRFGVELGSSSLESVKQIIDTKIEECPELGR